MKQDQIVSLIDEFEQAVASLVGFNEGNFDSGEQRRLRLVRDQAREKLLQAAKRRKSTP